MDTLGLGPAIMSFIERLSSLRRLKCTSIIENGPQSVSFIERLFGPAHICSCYHSKWLHNNNLEAQVHTVPKISKRGNNITSL